MKRFFSLSFLIFILVFAVSCGQNDTYELEPYQEEASNPEPSPEPEPTPEPTIEPTPEPELDTPIEHISVIPVDETSRMIRLMQDIFDEDNGELWGVDLFVPFMFTDFETRHVVASQQDSQGRFIRQGDVYVGVLPDGLAIFGGTIGFSGMPWATVEWWHGLYYETSDARILLNMINAAFMVSQNELIYGRPQGTGQAFFNYSSELRVFIQLELAALLRALTSENEAIKLAAVHDALSIRNERRERVLLGRGDRELEILSGTAFYTSLMLAYDSLEERMKIIEDWARYINRSNIASVIGALYSFLLDDFGVDWKTDLTFETNLGDSLKDALGVEELTPFGDLDLEIYNYSEITAQEATRLEARLQRREYIIESFANYPWLAFEAGWDNLVSVYNHESFTISNVYYWYGNVVIATEAGQLTINNGPLQHGFNFEEVFIPIKHMTIEENRVVGHNWELELNDGFEIFELFDGSGYRVRRVRN